ncbi:hypothetical protein B0I27_104227 [Arcticibacter pallidicorallinus]|uniref:Uncharacterized protein n=1 Tax=Arcticibacter pallidicorallinus TaxID=1259464 RepID=A0A2T0U5L7_9SPHI|nr:S-4TM family putative pore-forming effector [Arcticibacter pallidicorallinus]PRY53217.1 hypothetical protein B0I27_104227 [Arcticibacter pallidicorallinus]
MNRITTAQNEPIQLERLAAQRELYTSAKLYHIWQIFFMVVIPLMLSLLLLLHEPLIPFAAFYGIISAILDPLLFDAVIQRRIEKAAKIQELFDCAVLRLSPSPLKTSNDQMVEDVLTHYNAHKKIQSNIEKIKDWYPQAIEVLPYPIARLICQRTNCYWDSRLRRRYSNFVSLLGIGLFIAFMLFGITTNKNFNDLVLIASALLPLVQFCLKQSKDQKETAKRLDRLVDFAKQAWDEGMSNTSSNLEEVSRRLQDEIYDHRSKSALILNFMYRRFLKKDEEIMNSTAEALVRDAKEHGLI